MERKITWETTSGDKADRIKRWQRTRNYFSNNGYVLIFSLWAIVILGFIALNFTRNTSNAIKTEITFTERIKNVYAARSACIYAIQMLLQINEKKQLKSSSSLKPKKNKDNNNEMQDNVGWEPRTIPYLLEIGDRRCNVFIGDEEAKININKITDKNKDSFITFLKVYNIDEIKAEIITDSILDWLDKDELHHVNGAEKQYYESLPEPYEPKNGLFESVEELSLVRGITPEVFELLRECLTIYGSGKININFARKEVLLCIPTFKKEIVDAIIQHRNKKGPIKNIKKLEELLKPYGIIGSSFSEVTKNITIGNSNFITINSISSSSNKKIRSSYKVLIQKGVGHCKIIAAYPE